MTSSPQQYPRGAASGSVRQLARFNTVTQPDALDLLSAVCASPRWVRGMLSHRPYADAEALFAANDAVVARLSAADLAAALAAHPPIGRPRPDDAVSTGEQQGMARATARLKAEMLELNLAYQERFGHVFLICATGLTGEQMRDAVRERLRNPPERELDVVRVELGRINRVRLARLTAGA
ncbi:2-oxo-4-hydroxy-4-carboxy-5-ureidoimidazoline decarboxylase [Streptomyces albipurpureus]|uniref:2-oxo-4-hydroxy-4-carboxy-5-ureidoimidazoline decarboxylase n=1 Tax=Streptomyces albipurpureus TaxID=2897419 RepID=A0ABT0UWG0_9ACTN|nr:2-oxo-4-hydroxy-4-carboxy-5-ureidoimidazoline decarboxylase [Streptomyces sp. CWNU-1]MCM2392776.1 2-oxo-4-hydroxy-4-carboxy-5-ureidoimidazoline decarboxylase [Streptomyces sp. CWNU-1]